ncbi:MAG: GGDEF domain-containing protein [Burkholderiaceae bacterium]|nr:GGDEF domain-containing protein [Burkholderiaceae bacterium]
MSLTTPSLMIDGVTLMAMSAAIITLFGGIQIVYRGFWWWVGAQWSATLGLLLLNFTNWHTSILPLANLLVLQWPIVVLGGVRRFYPRHALRVAPSVDLLMLATIFTAWLALWVVQGRTVAEVAAVSAGASILHLYSAVLTAKLHDFRRSSALKILFVALCFTGVVHMLRAIQAHSHLLSWLSVDSLRMASGFATTMMALLMVYLCVQLTYERTSRKMRESQRQLRYLADMDMLTEVPNRRHFYELADEALASTETGAASIVMFDIDHFKLINDEMGHAAGDAALRKVARCVRDTLRGRDVAGRIGGDEFALLLPETPGQDAVSVADRIATQLRVHTDADFAGPLSLSFGVVLVKPDENINEAMRRADRALYEAKRQGRSCAVIASGTDEDLVFSTSQAMGLSTI